MILVTDQLPEYNKDVLVKLANGKFAVAQLRNDYLTSIDHSDDNWYPSDSIESNYPYPGTSLPGGVIAWCELPN